ncbi:Hypothetical protein HVR_LOCUS599 [uncultured virus]|nr:Hypothetical protein HVR_LOCUS599 [uncultured virus]
MSTTIVNGETYIDPAPPEYYLDLGKKILMTQSTGEISNIQNSHKFANFDADPITVMNLVKSTDRIYSSIVSELGTSTVQNNSSQSNHSATEKKWTDTDLYLGIGVGAILGYLLSLNSRNSQIGTATQNNLQTTNSSQINSGETLNVPRTNTRNTSNTRNVPRTNTRNSTRTNTRNDLNVRNGPRTNTRNVPRINTKNNSSVRVVSRNYYEPLANLDSNTHN